MLIPQILTDLKCCKTQLSQMKMQPFPHLCCPTSFFFFLNASHSALHLNAPICILAVSGCLAGGAVPV